MTTDTAQLISFFILLLCAAGLTVFVFLPYLSAILLAVILAIVFSPVHDKVVKFTNSQNFLGALISTLLVIIFIIIPIALFGALLTQELFRLYSDVSNSSFNVIDFVGKVIDFVGIAFPAVADYLTNQLASFNPDQYIERWLGWGLQALNAVFAQTFHLIISGAISILALFYLFKDGNRAVRYIAEVSPISKKYSRIIFSKIENAVNSVIRGRVLVGIIQGILTGIAFGIVGVPAPVLWAGVAAVLSVIPMVGPGVVITPAVIYLLLVGNIWGGVILFAWAIVAIYFIDDILGPILIERGMSIHPFIILISILGGISLFGPIGFIAGPIVIALLFVLLELYPVFVSSKHG